MLEEAGREARIRAKQQRVFAAYDACVEMGNRHRRRTDGCLAIDLGMVALAHRIDVAAQPDAADWESAIASAFGDLRLLQQRQSATASSDEDEFGRHGFDPAIIGVLDRHAPTSTVLAVQANDFAVILNLEAGLTAQGFAKQ